MVRTRGGREAEKSPGGHGSAAAPHVTPVVALTRCRRQRRRGHAASLAAMHRQYVRPSTPCTLCPRTSLRQRQTPICRARMAAGLAAMRAARCRCGTPGGSETPSGNAAWRHRELVRLCNATARESETPGLRRRHPWPVPFWNARTMRAARWNRRPTARGRSRQDQAPTGGAGGLAGAYRPKTV